MILPKPYFERDGVVLYHADCRDVLPLLPRVDLVLTDPPYGIGEAWKGGCWKNAPGGRGRLWDNATPEWDVTTFSGVEDFPKLCRQCVVWGGNYYAFPPSRCWLIWDKMQKHSGSECEMAWANFDLPTRVFRMSRLEAYCGKDFKEHPNQKPVDLFKWCVGLADDPQTILDPFAGSGTTLRAAMDLGRKAIGIEISEAYCEIAARRLQQRNLQFGETL